MAGLPGQTLDDLAADIAFFAAEDVDMIGMGPYIPHPDTPLGQGLPWTDAAAKERLELGLCLRRTPFGNEVRCYDAERTVCDLVRSRRRLDEELVLAGLRNWGASPGRDPARLARYARALGVFDRVKTQVEVLL